ncbi:MAG: fused MFS/spermidine synthase [Acidiferrobacterales bacterium]
MSNVKASNNLPSTAPYRRIGYGTTLFLSSAGALIIEIVAGRMLAPYVGMSLYTWTAIIAVVLAGLSLGHWVGGELSGGTRSRSCGVLAAAMLLAAGTAAASLVLIRLLSPGILASGIHPILAIVLLAACLFFLPSLFVGVVSPILTKLAVDEAPYRPGRVIGQMYALGAVGSIVGTLAAGYLFISWIGSIGTVLAVAGVYALLGGVFAVISRVSPRTAGAVSIIAVAVLVAAFVTGQRIAAFASPCTEESNYYCIRVIDYAHEIGRPSALMVLDHLGHGINDRDEPTWLHTSYAALTDRLLQIRMQDRGTLSAFFVGGGAYTLPRAWSTAFPQARLTVAEIDPAVTRIAENHMWLEAAPNLRIKHQDARLLLQSLPPQPQFDIIVGDAFHDISIPAHLVTREFAREVQRRLKPQGLYTLNVVDNAFGPQFLLSAVRTLLEVFPNVEVWVDAEQIMTGGRMTFLVSASTRPTPAARIESEAKSEDDTQRTWLRWPTDKLKAEIAKSEVPILTDNYAPVDRLMFPVLKKDL